MRSKLSWLAALVLAVCCIGGLAACGKKDTATLISIELINPPTKVVYEIGESLDVSGASIKATYSDDSTKEVTVTAGMVTGFDSSTAGSKTCTVTYRDGTAKTTTFTVTVNAAAPETAVPTSIRVDWDTEFYLDEGLSLTGAHAGTVTVVYSDNTTKDVALTREMLPADFRLAEGVQPVTVTYTEEADGVPVTLTKKVNVNGTVRTEYTVAASAAVDCFAPAALTLEDARWGGVSKAVTLTGKALSFTATDAGITFAESELDKLPDGKSAVKLTTADAGDVFVAVAKAYMIHDYTQFAAINDKLDGYYMLACDLDFGEYPAAEKPIQIGAAPRQDIWETPEGGTEPIDSQKSAIVWSADDHFVQGTPFTGTFDGNGYAIKNYKYDFNHALLGAESAWKRGSYGYGLFAYIGKTGVVKNFTARGWMMKAGNQSGLISACNEGVIRDICIEADCTMFVQYTDGAIAAYLNRGTVENVVSYLTEEGSGYGERDLKFVFSSETVTDNVAATNSYLAPADDKSAALASDAARWIYHEALGTVLVNDAYLRILTTDFTWALGAQKEIALFLADPSKTAEISVWNVETADAEAKDYIGWDAATGKLCFKEGYRDHVAAGDRIKVGFTVQSGMFVAATFTVGDKIITDAQLITDTLTVKENNDIALSDIEIAVTYSDGTQATMHPDSIDGYVKTQIGSQTVTVVFGDYEFDLAVTVEAKRLESVTWKAKPVNVVYLTDATALDLTGAVLKVEYDNGENAEVEVTADMCSAADFTQTGAQTITVEYFGVKLSFEITVNSADVTVKGIALTGTASKTEYLYGDEIVQDDLGTLSLTVTYSDESQAMVPVTVGMLTYDTAKLGAETVTITYEEKEASYEIRIADAAKSFAVALTAPSVDLAFDETTETAAAIDWSKCATFTLEMRSGAKQALAVADVTASAVTAGHNEVTFEYGGLTAQSAEIDVWYVLTGVKGWKAMNAGLAGYYKLGANIDFEAKSANFTRIGAVGFNKSGDDKFIVVDDGETLPEYGTPAAFTGKFDGAGYALLNIKAHYSSVIERPSDYRCYAYTLFANIGAGAEVGSFTLRGASMKAGQDASFVAGLNKGTIHDVMIASDSVLYSNYKRGGAFASQNYGTIRDSVCYVSEMGTNGAAQNMTTVGAGTAVGEAENCLIAPTEEVTALTAKANWKYHAALGTVLVNEKTVLIAVAPTELAIDGTAKLELLRGGEGDIVVWSWPNAGDSGYFTLRADAEDGSFTLGFNAAAQAAYAKGTLTAGTVVKLGVRVSGGDYATTNITLAAAAASSCL